MASVIRRVRRTRVKLEHGYDAYHWRRHGSMHPDAVRNRARHPLVNPDEYPVRVESYPWITKPVDKLARIHEQLDEIKAEAFDCIPQPEGPRDAAELVDAYPAH